MMKLDTATLLFFTLPFTYARNCTPSAFQWMLPLNASVVYTGSVSNGSFAIPGSNITRPTSLDTLPSLTNLPSPFCAVQISVTSSSSAYSFGLFLPTEFWNGRFLAVGNGGFQGSINWLDMAAGVGGGFASMSTDTGHNGTLVDATWAYRDEDSRRDWGWRAMHGSVVLAKTVVRGFYGGSGAEYSYYMGCATGGRQGLKEVQMFPEDFDGVLAGDPAWWTSHLQPWTTKLALYNLPATADYHIPQSLFHAIGAEVLRQCDPQDGLRDTIIMDPAGCSFFAEALLCSANVTNQTEAGCLRAPQIGTLYKIYNNYIETDQTFVFPHLALGSEAQWFQTLSDIPNPIGYAYPQYFLDLGPDWSLYDYNYSIVQLADQLDPGDATADDYDISPFWQRGGKLLMYHGWSDGLIPPESSTYFYKKTLETLAPRGIDLDSFFRLFLVPGMTHCVATPPEVEAPWYFAGANQAGVLGTSPGSIHSVPGFEDARHDALLALIAWTEKGTAPENIIATKWRNDTLIDEVLRQRPLCPYPKQAMYVGEGNPDEAGNWRCRYLYEMPTKC